MLQKSVFSHAEKGSESVENEKMMLRSPDWCRFWDV
jgi:hypothetical protein